MCDEADHFDLNSAYERLYKSLRRRARNILLEQRSYVTYTATALANEVYCRLRRMGSPKAWQSERHFFADASRAIHNAIVDHLRAKRTIKRGLAWRRLDIVNMDQVADERVETQRGQFEGPLQKLEADRPDLMALVDLRVIRGLNFSEIAQLQGRSKRTIERQWYLVRRQLTEYLLQDGHSVRRNRKRD